MAQALITAEKSRLWLVLKIWYPAWLLLLVVEITLLLRKKLKTALAMFS
ncbi:hypothetical protein O9992_04110 [Vibrio lentus]|nr:hypothetical protein [Vibrio lentus]